MANGHGAHKGGRCSPIESFAPSAPIAPPPPPPPPLVAAVAPTFRLTSSQPPSSLLLHHRRYHLSPTLPSIAGGAPLHSPPLSLSLLSLAPCLLFRSGGHIPRVSLLGDRALCQPLLPLSLAVARALVPTSSQPQRLTAAIVTKLPMSDARKARDEKREGRRRMENVTTLAWFPILQNVCGTRLRICQKYVENLR